MKASEHLEAVRRVITSGDYGDKTDVILHALEFLLEPFAEKEKTAEQWRATAKPDALSMGEALHQDMADHLSRVKTAREVALNWEDSTDGMLKSCGRRMLEILGRPLK